MYHTTGLARDDIIEVCGLVHAECLDTPEHTWPPILGLFKSIVVTLTYLRRNRVQAELAESFAVSQSTISRAIAGLTRCSVGYWPATSRWPRTWTQAVSEPFPCAQQTGG